uniref:Cyanobacterial aminoacyl-tRNA synthetase CAAD domain-containing protein n=2 Tax=Zea mays TaxID=4577 RepID=A0A804QEN9_MAIZE
MSHARASPLWRCPLPGTHPHKASASPIRREPPTARPQGACACSRCSFLMATACHLAAPLGLAPLPRGCASAGVVAVVRCARSSGSKIPRGVAVRATSGGEGATEEVPEIVKAAQDAWDKVEDKYAVATIGVAAIVALWTVVGAIKAIDKLPLLPGVLEIVGIGYTGWFTYRNLVFQPDREALIGKIKSTYKEITGSSN